LTDLALPPGTVARVLALHRARGAAWLRELPSRVDALAEQWDLVHVGRSFTDARVGLVAPARRGDGTPVVLKVVPSSEWLQHEAHALAHWRGCGAVRLEAADLQHSAILLERVFPGLSLATMCASDDRAATTIAADVVAQLRAVPGNGSLRPDLPRNDAHALPAIEGWIERLQTAPDEHPLRGLRDACTRAYAIATELLADAEPHVLLHGDLHHDNLLSAGRVPRLAIDPKGVMGPPEVEFAALLRNPRTFLMSQPRPVAVIADRLAVLSERSGDDPRRLAAWGFALAVLAAAWSLEDREGAPDARRWLACAEVLRAAGDARPARSGARS
jgi:streptomycin 6-kinase